MKTNIKKLKLCSLALLSGLLLISCNNQASNSSSPSTSTGTDSAQTSVIADAKMSISEGRYDVYGCEWGAGVEKIVLKLNGTVSGIDKSTFDLFAGSNKIADDDLIQATVTDAYTCDENGNKVTTSSEYVAFDITPEHSKCSPFDSDSMTLINSWAVYKAKLELNTDLTIGDNNVKTGAKAIYTFDDSERRTPEFDDWEQGEFGAGDQTLTTIAYTPDQAKTDESKNPLIVWLHGAGGGGTDPIISVMDTQVINFAHDEIQSYFTTDTQKGAYILSVQTPTFWCNDGEGGYNSNLSSDAVEGQGQPGMYTDILFKTIQNYVDTHTDVDPSRIYLGGCSNGGYMTMEMMINHSNYFAAYYPTCEGYRNYYIGDSVINKMKDLNIYFTQAEGDELFPPMEFTVPTYYRLIKAGAQNVHFNFLDSNCLYAKGYIQHYSWVYVFNNEVENDFDTAKVLADYDNLDFSDYGALTGQTTYVSNANNTVKVDGGLFGWMSRQSL